MKTLIFVRQDNCPFCDALEPLAEEACKILNISMEYVDVTNNWPEAEFWGVTQTPTLIVAEPKYHDVMTLASNEPITTVRTKFDILDRIEARRMVPLLAELKAKFA